MQKLIRIVFAEFAHEDQLLGDVDTTTAEAVALPSAGWSLGVEIPTPPPEAQRDVIRLCLHAVPP